MFKELIMQRPIHTKKSVNHFTPEKQTKKVQQKTVRKNVSGAQRKATSMDHLIKNQHAVTKQNIVNIYDLMKKVAYRHSDRHAELNKLNEAAFLCFQDILSQMLTEEHELYPAMNKTVKTSPRREKHRAQAKIVIEENITLYKKEHAKALKSLRLFRKITNNYKLPDDACNHYQTLFEKLKRLENELKAYFHLSDKVLSQNMLAARHFA